MQRPFKSHKTWLESEAYYRLLEWCYDNDIYDRGTNEHQSDGFAAALNELIDFYEEHQSDDQ